MDNGDRAICLQQDQDDAEEDLSLTDFPLHHHSPAADSQPRTRRSSSEPPEFFEFLKDDIMNSSDVMCSADDIIVCGKLMPFKGQTVPCCPKPNPPKEKAKLSLRSRSESTSVQKGPAVKFTRSSRSLDGTSHVIRSNIGKPEFGLSDSRKGTKPRWYVSMMMFGVAKFPTEMELRDIKTRQLRRNTSTLVSSVDGQVSGGDNFPASHRHRSGWGGSWKLLKALSCKDHASVAVATSSFESLISNHYSY